MPFTILGEQAAVPPVSSCAPSESSSPRVGSAAGSEVPELADAALMAAVRGGSRRALEEIYRRHRVAVVRRATAVANRHIAEEVAHDVFLLLLQRPARYDERRSSLRSYLMMCAQGRAIDLMRSERSRRAREDRTDPTDRSRMEDADELVIRRLDAHRLRQAVSLLPERERAVVEEAYFGGHSYRGVAQRLGLPEGTVKTRMRLALQRLRLLLDDDPSPRRTVAQPGVTR